MYCVGWLEMSRIKVLTALLLLSLSSLNLSAGQYPSYNCSHMYMLSSNGKYLDRGSSSQYCKDSCLQATPALVVSTNPDCTLLQHVLQSYNPVIPDGDCLELQFMPGEYRLSSLSQIQVSYSMVLSAPWGGVSMTCSEASDTVCDSDGGVNEVAADNFMIAVNGSQTKAVFVSIDSLSFSNCSKRLQFNSLTNLTVTNSTFKGFPSSALDLFNIDNALIKDSIFMNCTSRTANAQFRANGGAVSVAYFYTDYSREVTCPQLDILGCTFENNSAYTVDLDQLNLALINSIISGRGGGLGILPQGNLSNVDIHIKDTMFINNWAEEYGGGIWVIVSGENTYHDFVLEGCIFRGNYGGEEGYGGGMHMAFLLRNVNSPRPVRVNLTGCSFDDNFAGTGGGFSIVEVYSQGRGNELSVSNTRFVGNRATVAGAAIMLQTFSYVQNRLQRFYYNFTDCMFYNNEAFGGTFGTGFNNVNFFGTILFSGNVGPAVRLVGALLHVQGNLTVTKNTVPTNVEGGALFIQAFGQVKVKPGSALNFINNTGGTGSAIVVQVQRASPVFSELIFNPQCFLIYENPIAQPGEWENVSITFSGNKAVVGPAVFISHLQHCSWYSSYRIGDNLTNEIRTVFSVGLFPNWTAFDFEVTNMAISHHEDPYDNRFYVQTEPFQIVSSVTEDNKLAIRPGQTIPISLTALDQFRNPTYLIARVSDGRSAINIGAFSQAGRRRANITYNVTNMVVFDPSLLPVDPAVGIANLTYGFSERDNLTGLMEISIPVTIDIPFTVLEAEEVTFNVTLSPCQPGYNLVELNSIYTCVCSNRSTDILTCTDNEIILKDGTWAGVELGSTPHLDITICPVPYCQCRVSGSSEVCVNVYLPDSQNPNEQCHPTRQGTLCGQCVNGTAVGVLRTNCRKCTTSKYYAIPLLIVGDVLVLSVIFLVIMKLDFHFPYSLKGLLFYLQTAYYATDSFPASFWDARKYMLFTSSALNLYFPYDFCLSPKTEALVTFTVKFIPPLIAFVMSVVVTIGVYAMRARTGRRQVWRAVWFLLLLLYAPLLHTCTAILKCPNIPSFTGHDEAKHWFYDGEVECFQTPAHIVLSTVAIVVLTPLVLLVPATFIFILVTSLKKNIRYRTMDWILQALSEGYKDDIEARCYAAWELARRLLLVSIVVALPGRSVASAYVVIASFAVHVFFQPYKKLSQNILETLVFLNYTFLLLIRSNETILDAVNSGRYSGNLVPDTIGDNLPSVDNVAWLFIPLFYLPLVFAAFFSVGALVYRVTKSTRQWKRKKEEEQSSDDQDYQLVSHNQPISTTTVDISSL